MNPKNTADPPPSFSGVPVGDRILDINAFKPAVDGEDEEAEDNWTGWNYRSTNPGIGRTSNQNIADQPQALENTQEATTAHHGSPFWIEADRRANVIREIEADRARRDKAISQCNCNAQNSSSDSFYEWNRPVTTTPVLKTLRGSSWSSICRYCYWRNIPCNGFENDPSGRCYSCRRFQQDCRVELSNHHRYVPRPRRETDDETISFPPPAANGAALSSTVESSKLQGPTNSEITADSIVSENYSAA